MTEQFKQPSNGAEWEQAIWEFLRKNPNTTSRKLAASLPGLTLGAASGFLSKLAKRNQVAGVNFPDLETKREVFHYSISTPEFVPTTRSRNRRVAQPISQFDFSHEDRPIKLITDTVSANANVVFDPETYVSDLNLVQGRELYDYLHNIYGARK